MKPLIDLAAMVTGKHISCDDIERLHLPLDELLFRKVEDFRNTVFDLISAQ